MQVFNISRPDLKDNFNAIQFVLKEYRILELQRGAEIGVRHGFFSEHLLQQNPNLKMYLVDPYLPYIDLEYEFTEDEQDVIKTAAKERLDVFYERAIWQYKSSQTAVISFPDHAFDFVFIDAEHTYLSVLKDIYAWHSKIRLGGLLCGHDFDMHGVQKAVKEFADTFHKDIFHILTPSDTWYIFV